MRILTAWRPGHYEEAVTFQVLKNQTAFSAIKEFFTDQKEADVKWDTGLLFYDQITTWTINGQTWQITEVRL